jgi:protoporphyrin/coproporphyrin ferrochelatase
MKSAIVFINLGTPSAPTPRAVRQFLREFLSDRRVVEVPRLIWLLILYLFILPLRPRRVAKAYQQIWFGNVSPLRHFSEQLVLGVGKKISAQYPEKGISVHLAMTYGEPSLARVLDGVMASGCERILFVPLYPQYSATTTAAAMDIVMRYFSAKRNIPQWSWIRDYHDHPEYIAALAGSIESHWQEQGRGDYLLASFHGIPKRNIELGDPYQQHCERTAKLVAEKLGLNDSEWQLSYQSRLGKAEWLQPYTDKTLAALPGKGVKKLDVICPAFAVECLETLEEIDGEGHDIFTEGGGDAFRYIPCLNDSDIHQNVMLTLCRNFIEQI